MKATSALFGLCILLFQTTKAQQLLPLAEKAYVDSLNSVLQSRDTDSSKAIANFLLSDYWRARDTGKSRIFLVQARQLGNRYPYLKALYPFYEGQFYFNTDRAKAAQAFKAAQTALLPFNTPSSYKTIAASWFNYGLMVRNEKGDSFVIDILLNKTIPLAERSGDIDKLGHYYIQLASLLMNNSRFDKAESYNQKAIDLLKNGNPSSPSLLFAYLSATSTYIYDNKNAEAKVYLDKAKDLLAPYPTSINYPDYYYNEGLYFTAISQFGRALTSLDKGIALAQQYHQRPMLQVLIFRKYNIFLEQKDYLRARQFLMELIKNGILTAEANDRLTLYGQLAKTNGSLGDMAEAYHWSSKYNQLSDSLHRIQLTQKIAELEARFQNSEDQKQISTLQEEKARLALSARNSRLFIGLLGTACLLLLVTAIFSWYFRRNQRKLQRLSLTQALLDGEERERKRIAQDLHDGLGGMLAGIKMNLSGWATANADPLQDPKLHLIIARLDQSLSELRRIARNMMPESLLRSGLETALKDLCEFYTGKDVQIEFQPFGLSSTLPLTLQINIYRIVQELLSNAVRHADATTIIVQCSQRANILYITVEDNGEGFDTRTIGDKDGLGLMNVRNRVEYMMGEMDTASTPGEGTTINIELRLYGKK